MSIQIKNSKIKGSVVAENSIINENEEKSWAKKHPVIVTIIITAIFGFIFLFSFWENIINWIESYV